MKTQAQETVAARIRELNPHMVGRTQTYSLPYTEQEEALLKVLREHALHDPVFREKWASGRCSPADIVVVLAGYGVRP